MESFEQLLMGSAEAHGHLCAGQVIGVRMAMLGCELICLDNPRRPDQIKKLIVYVEIDRCATDAIAYVTGARLGRRSLKFVDYGIMAATFVNLESKRAYRIVSTEESRELTSKYAPFITNKPLQQVEAYKVMPLEELFIVQEVAVEVPEADLPGPSRFKAVCAQCGQMVRDGKEVVNNGQALCVPCALGAYFRLVKTQKAVA